MAVEDFHSYFVGEYKVLVHNCDILKPAKDILPSSLKREFPAEHLNKSLSQIQKELKSAKGATKQSLQKAKKLLQQSKRLLGKVK